MMYVTLTYVFFGHLQKVVEKRGPDGVWTKVNNFVTGTTCKVRNLQEGKPYDFRVMAENAIGRSEPCLTEDTIIPKSKFGRPSAPGTPVCVDSTPESVTLQWSRPSNDGGTPITGCVSHICLIHSSD